MYFLIGAFLGVITGVPIGPVNVAVIDAAYRHSLRRAFGAAVGGCAGDVLFSYLGLVWVGPYIYSNPIVPPILQLVSGVVLVSYGVVTLRAQELETTATTPKKTEGQPTHFLGGFLVGFALICLNPAALVTWVVVVAPILGKITAGQGSVTAIGVGVGSLAWFSFVAILSHKGKNVLGHRMIIVTRIVGGLLIGYGIYLVGKGAWYFIS
jgi:threonine/homoserine/homoserine lactone efflux protein